jgi:hypothetical protein
MRCFFLWMLRDHSLGRDQKSCNRSCPLQRVTDDLRRVDDVLAREVAIFARLGVVAVTVIRVFEDFCGDHRAIFARFDRNEVRRSAKRSAHDGDTDSGRRFRV